MHLVKTRGEAKGEHCVWIMLARDYKCQKLPVWLGKNSHMERGILKNKGSKPVIVI